MVVIPLLITILSISGFVVFYNGLQHTSLHSVHDIGGNTSVIIEPNCYNTLWIKEVIISNAKEYGIQNKPVTVTFYKTRKNTLQHTTKRLRKRMLYYNPSFVTYRSSMNYFFGDVPIYLAGNGTLTYTFSFRADVNFTVCPLELHMFDDYQKYHHYLLHPYDNYNGPISSLNCTLNSVNSTVQTFIVNFHLYPNTFYYFAVGLTKNLYINITISGNVEVFQVSDLTPEKCVLNSSTPSCTFPIGHSSVSYAQGYLCLLAQFSDKNRGNVTVDVILSKLNAGSVTCLSFSIVSIIITLCIVLALIMFIIWRIKKETAIISRYSDLLMDD